MVIYSDKQAYPKNAAPIVITECYVKVEVTTLFLQEVLEPLGEYLDDFHSNEVSV